MDESSLMDVLQPPGKLYRHIQNTLQGFSLIASVQPSVFNPVFQTAALDVLSEHAGDIPHAANIVAGDDVRVQAQVQPGLRLAEKVLPCCQPIVQRFRQRRFDRQVHVPVAVMDTVDCCQPPAPHFPLDLVQIQDYITLLPFLR
jgi:hypothetical protein